LGIAPTAPAEEVPLEIVQESSDDVLQHLGVYGGVLHTAGRGADQGDEQERAASHHCDDEPVAVAVQV